MLLLKTITSIGKIFKVNIHCVSYPNFILLILKDVEVIDIRKNDIFNVISEKTSGIGVDVILEPSSYYLEKYNCYSVDKILPCIAPHGTWITSRPLQVFINSLHLLLLFNLLFYFFLD